MPPTPRGFELLPNSEQELFKQLFSLCRDFSYKNYENNNKVVEINNNEWIISKKQCAKYYEMAEMSYWSTR